jgi:hypothetical protein
MADLLTLTSGTVETVLDLTTVARVNILRGLAQSGNATTTDALALDSEVIKSIIKMTSRQARINVMNRAFAKGAYTERFDVDPGQRDFWLSACPVAIDTDIDTDITIFNSIDTPRDFTSSSNEIDADYIIINSEGQRSGLIHLDTSPVYGRDALSIAYTGGMATESVVNGANGATTADGTTFTSTGQTFTTKGVAAGDILAITTRGAADHGLWEIGSVGSETTLTISSKMNTDASVTAFTATAPSLDYEIIDGGTDTIVGLFPHVAFAIDEQCTFMFNNRQRMGISAEAIVGASVTHIRPFQWLDHVLSVLQGEARDLV